MANTDNRKGARRVRKTEKEDRREVVDIAPLRYEEKITVIEIDESFAPEVSLQSFMIFPIIKGVIGFVLILLGLISLVSSWWDFGSIGEFVIGLVFLSLGIWLFIKTTRKLLSGYQA